MRQHSTSAKASPGDTSVTARPPLAELPARPNLLQLRHQAKDLLRGAKAGTEEALDRLRAVSDRPSLSAAQLAVAREYGFASWPRLKLEVDRRRLLNQRDLGRLKQLLAEDPSLAASSMERWCDHRRGVRPLSYIAMLRFDSKRLGLPRDLPGTGAVARLLIQTGARVNGHPDDQETPLITAASYGNAEVARVLIAAGADIEATSAPDSGGVPGGTALQHAAAFGMTEVVDVLVAAGARIGSLEEAAAAGDVSGWLAPNISADAKVRALIMAADHQRLDAIEQLLAADTPIDAVDPQWGRQALCVAVQNERIRSVRRLLDLGADPRARDGKGRTPLEYANATGQSRLTAIIATAVAKKT
jgi:hypothetical protein